MKLLQNLARDGLAGVEDKLRATTFRPLAVILELGFVFLNILGVDFLVDLSLLILLLDVTNSVIDDGDAKPDCTNFFCWGHHRPFMDCPQRQSLWSWPISLRTVVKDRDIRENVGLAGNAGNPKEAVNAMNGSTQNSSRLPPDASRGILSTHCINDCISSSM